MPISESEFAALNTDDEIFLDDFPFDIDELDSMTNKNAACAGKFSNEAPFNAQVNNAIDFPSFMMSQSISSSMTQTQYTQNVNTVGM